METRGWRAVPPTLWIAFAASLVSSTAQLVLWLTAKEPWTAQRFHVTMSGIGFATSVLLVIGAFELAQRLTGRAALGMKIFAVGQVVALAMHIAWNLALFKSDVYEHRWIYTVNAYGYWASSVIELAGLVIALWGRIAYAIGIAVIGLVTWPPPFLQDTIYGWLEHDGKTGAAVQFGVWGLRVALVAGAVALVARGPAPVHRALASSGMRTIARSLWFRLLAVLGLAFVMLVAVGSRGTGGLEMVKLGTLTAAIVTVIALIQLGVGALRAARASLPELGTVTLALAGAGSLWAAGVTFYQLPYVYKMLYGARDSFGSADYLQALSLAQPLVIIASVGFVALAIGMFAGERRSELLGHAQSKGVAYVLLMLVALAITTWLLQDAKDAGSAMMMLVIAAGASLIATVLMAKLCTQAADELEREPGLPQATVV